MAQWYGSFRGMLARLRADELQQHYPCNVAMSKSLMEEVDLFISWLLAKGKGHAS